MSLSYLYGDYSASNTFLTYGKNGPKILKFIYLLKAFILLVLLFTFLPSNKFAYVLLNSLESLYTHA